MSSKLACEFEICSCKQQRANKLYENFSSWLSSPKAFHDLTEEERVAWTYASLGKKKPEDVTEVKDKSENIEEEKPKVKRARGKRQANKVD